MTDSPKELATTNGSLVNYTENEIQDIIQTMNDDMARLMIPATVYISVLMVLGLFGNIMVCFYYGFKTKRTVNSLFIVVLAIYDVTVCAICMPTEIVDIVLFYTFENNAACKILRFVNYQAAIGSILTLIAIATDRYKKICKAVKPQMTMQRAKISVAIVFLLSVLLSWPSLAIYGSIKVNIPNDLGIELLGSDCTSTKELKYKKYVWSFNIVHFVLFFVCSITLIVLYSVIGRTIYKHRKRMMTYNITKLSNKQVTNETSLSTTPSQVVTKEDSCGKAKEPDHDKKEERTRTHTSVQGSESLAHGIDEKTEHAKKSTIDNETIKLTFIMIAVTTVFIASFLPYLSLTIWRIYKGQHEAEFLSGAGLVGFKIGSRSFLLNSSLNPWIYGFFNSNFRRFVLRSCFRR